MLQVARRRLPPSVELHEGWADRLPYADGSFDVVVSCNMFHYIPEPMAAVKEGAFDYLDAPVARVSRALPVRLVPLPPAVKERLKATTEAAVARGAFGAPTMFVGDEMFFGKDRLRDVEEEIVRVQSISA